MKKETIDNELREYVRSNLSPKEAERDLISSLYAAFKGALGASCFMSGSFARFTASRPVHDLDILTVVGRFDPQHLDPRTILERLEATIRDKFVNPTEFHAKISRQSHSITVAFDEAGREVFAVDVVPAFTSGLKNEFGDDIYWVPEILVIGRKNRAARYQDFERTKKSETEWWIRSDPRGYITSAENLNTKNSDFRKATKFVKRWKHNCKTKDGDFKIKSFHIEQTLFDIYTRNPSFGMFDGIFRFFCNLPEMVLRPRITTLLCHTISIAGEPNQ